MGALQTQIHVRTQRLFVAACFCISYVDNKPVDHIIGKPVKLPHPSSLMMSVTVCRL
jgi:hypothetical protein